MSYACPLCARAAICVNDEAENWMVCPVCRIKSHIGTNFLSSWEDETEELWERNRRKLENYREVHLSWPHDSDLEVDAYREAQRLWEADAGPRPRYDACNVCDRKVACVDIGDSSWMVCPNCEFKAEWGSSDDYDDDEDDAEIEKGWAVCGKLTENFLDMQGSFTYETHEPLAFDDALFARLYAEAEVAIQNEGQLNLFDGRSKEREDA